MTFNPPTQGINHVPAYQIPGLPWVTSSFATGIVRHDFPYVAMSFTLKNNSTGSLAFAFTQNGFASSHSVILLPSEAFNAELRFKSIFISGSAAAEYSLFASLTTIPSRNMPALSGSVTPYSGSVTWEGIG
jgi:hypothetical protein